MTAYLTVAEFSTRSIMPSVDVDYLEAQHPGYLDARLASSIQERERVQQQPYRQP